MSHFDKENLIQKQKKSVKLPQRKCIIPIMKILYKNKTKKNEKFIKKSTQEKVEENAKLPQ